MSGPSGTLVSRNVFGEPDDHSAVATTDSSISQEDLRNTVTVIDVPNQSSSTQPSEIVKNDTDKGEIDPLEAFMQDIDGQVQAAKVHAKGAPKVGFTDYGELDDNDPLEHYIQQLSGHGSESTTQDSTVQATDANRSRRMPIREVDSSAYEFDSEHLAPTHPVKKDVEPLSAMDHSTITYLPIEKRFYTEHPEVSAMDTTQLQSLRQTSRIQVWGANVPKPGTAFYHFGFDQTFLASLNRCGYQMPTPIQQQAIPVALSGRDIIGIAKTGSGKTAAFLLPMLVHLMDQEELKKGEGPAGLVLAPTRELAQQIQNEARKLAKGYGITVMAVYGGTPKMDQFKSLRYGTVDIVVGTPGRLIDLVRMKATNLCRVSYLVLDEADRMFDLGFEPQVRSICDRVRPDRQTLLFSATFPSKIERLALQVATDPVRITIGKVGEASADITQSFHIFTNGTAKWDWIQQQMPTLCIEGSALVFAGQMGTVEKLAELLTESHIPCAALHGNLLQSERNRVLRDFRSGRIAVLVATDVAARGLDIAMVRTVINFEVARDIDSHIHRIGRTGRAGHQGTAITLLTPKDNHMAGFFVRHLELAGQTVPQTLMNLALQNDQFRQSRQQWNMSPRSNPRPPQRRHRSHDNTLAYLETNPMTISARLTGDRRGIGSNSATLPLTSSAKSRTRQTRPVIAFQASSQPSPGTQSPDPSSTKSYPQSKRKRNE
ncbi:hypothetical protein IWQ61_010159 [Dispira simplex]|nr:hypothetical protein IWQ61_010159 [Dispira simplex]